jgi:lysophospholipase L1-like esterase
MPLRLALAALILLAVPALHAQVPPTPEAPPQTNVPKDAPLNPALPTVFVVGDSTARNGANGGWGDHFAPLFDTARINVANRAAAGRSSRSFIVEGRWDKVLAEMKSGDYVLIQMGHNDSGDLGGAKPRGSLKGIGEETKDVPQLDGHVETVHTFGWYLRKYIADARAKGATPILLTTTVRNVWTNGQIERDFGYNDFIRQIGAEQHVPVADMGALAANKFQSLGQAKTAGYFPKDHTHTSPEGATINAICVAAALQQIHSPLAGYLKQ